jgi:hypothetical protein
MLIAAAFIALAWLTAPPPCKPGDLGLFIGDLRIAGLAMTAHPTTVNRSVVHVPGRWAPTGAS